MPTKERQTDRGGGRDRDRHTDRQTQTHTHTQRQTDTHTERQTEGGGFHGCVLVGCVKKKLLGDWSTHCAELRSVKLRMASRTESLLL